MKDATVSANGKFVSVICPHCGHVVNHSPSYWFTLGPIVKCPRCIKTMYIGRNDLGTAINTIQSFNS